MAGPSPLVIDFIVKDLDKVLRAMKSIQDAALGLEQKSSTAARAGADQRTREREKEAKQATRAINEQARAAQAAERAGAVNAAKELRARLSNQIRHLQALKAQEDAHHNYQRKLKEQWVRDSFKAQKQVEKERKSSEQRAIKDAQARQDFSVQMAKKLAIAESRARLDALKGGHRDPSTSPQKRLGMILDAKFKTPEEKAKAVEQDQHLRDLGKIRNKRIQEADALARAEGKAEKDQAAKTTKDLEKEAQKRLAIRERSAAMAGQFAKQEANRERLEREKAQRKAEAFGRVAGGIGSRTIQGATSIAGGVLRGIANVGGGFSVEDSVQRELQAQGLAASIASSTNTGISQGELLSKARGVAIEQGIDSADVLRGYEQVKKLNDDALPQALRIMPQLAKIANVTGTDMGDMGMLAANITASHAQETYVDAQGRKQKGISDEGLLRQLRVFSRQGIEGGVEISDFAKYGARITAGSGLFSGSRTAAEANLGMAAQVARQFGSAASPAEATMAAQRMATDMQKKAGHLKDLGVDVVDHNDPKGGFRSMEDIMVDLLKNKNKITELPEFKIGERGNRVLTGFADIYNSAGGGAAGEAAVRAQFAKGRKEIEAQEIEARNKKRNEAVDKQLNIAMTKLRIEVGTKLVPALIPFVGHLTDALPTLSRLLDVLSKVADFALKDPLAGLGLALTAALTKEIAAAGLKMGLERALASSLGAGAGLSVASAAIAITAATLAVQQMSEAENKRQAENVAGVTGLANAQVLLRPGATPEDIAKARAARDAAQTQLTEQEKSKGGSGLYYGAALVGAGARDLFNTMTSTNLQGGTTNSNIKDVQAARAQQMAVDEKAIADQKAALDKFNKQLEAAAARLNQVAMAPEKPRVPTGPIGERGHWPP